MVRGGRWSGDDIKSSTQKGYTLIGTHLESRWSGDDAVKKLGSARDAGGGYYHLKSLFGRSCVESDLLSLMRTGILPATTN